MKKYIIKKDFPGSKIGDVWVEENNGFMSPSGRQSIKMHKHLFTPFHDWFDEYKESNEYWYIDDLGRIQFSCEELDELEEHPNNGMIRNLYGNHFSSREEAELAVRKLKAWRRLKDKGFRFIDVRNIGKVIDYDVPEPYNKIGFGKHEISDDENEFYNDLMLLFGGEE